LRSKWAAGKAVRAGLTVRGRISESIRNRRATQPPAHFQRNPPGAASSWLFFRVARSTRMTRIWALRSRLEKQPTDLRRNSRDLGDGALIEKSKSRERLECPWPFTMRMHGNRYAGFPTGNYGLHHFHGMKGHFIGSSMWSICLDRRRHVSNT
jgi:hypothetical protein